MLKYNCVSDNVRRHSSTHLSPHTPEPLAQNRLQRCHPLLVLTTRCEVGHVCSMVVGAIRTSVIPAPTIIMTEEFIRTHTVPPTLEEIRAVLAHFNYDGHRSRAWAKGLDAETVAYIDKCRFKANNKVKTANANKRRAEDDVFRRKRNDSTARYEAKKARVDPEYKPMLARKERERRAEKKKAGVDLYQRRKESDGGIWNNILTSARQKGYDLPADARAWIVPLAKEPCHYCGAEEARGVDRKNNSVGYLKDNCLPSCSRCNMMKVDTVYDYFLALCCDLAKHFDDPTHKVSLTFSATRPHYSALQKSGKRVVEIDEETYNSLIAGDCYICGVPQAAGVDRFDSSLEYTLDNARSCCATCNYLKKDVDHAVMVANIRQIAARHPNRHFQGSTVVMGTVHGFGVDMHECSRCHVTKALDEFSQGKGVCKECRHKEARSDFVDTAPILPVGRKRCPQCFMNKLAADFPTDSASDDGLGVFCKVCQRCVTEAR